MHIKNRAIPNGIALAILLFVAVMPVLATSNIDHDVVGQDAANDTLITYPLSVSSDKTSATVITPATADDGSLDSAPVTITDSGVSHAGIALTFDDRYIDDWYAIRPILQKYNAHATFFITRPDRLDASQISKLQILQQDGNEIAFHGLNHLDAQEYLKTHTVQEYLDIEIIPGIISLQNKGFTPVSFAYPYGHDDPALTQALQAHFEHIRDTAYSYNDMIYYQYGSNQPFIAGIGIDEYYGNTLTNIYNGISKAKNEDKIIIFYGHRPVASDPDPALYETSHEKIDNILHYVSENGMNTYTISEIH